MRGHAESSRTSPPRTWVADPPPWGIAQERFKPESQPSGPEYHVAYRDVTQPPRWSTKGWTAMDDYTKPRRGTAPSTMGTSSLVPPTAPPRPAPGLAPLAPPCANEVRLQELLTLQRRKLHTEPGPGAYNARAPAGRRRFRRHHDPNVDGPFFLDQMPDGTSTRVKEISSLIRAPGDSGLGPGEYDGLLNKDAVMRSAPAVKVGTSDREGRTPHVKSLSVSRSIQNGIDWHVPVVVVTAVPQAPAAAANGANGLAGGAPPRPASPGDQYSDRGGGSAGTDGDRRSPAARQGDAGMGGEGQRESRSRDPSPGAVEAVEKYLGAPPAPPAPVSRAVRRQQERKPGDWDWNRLGHNYRTNWTTMHGGAYTQGEHPQPPRGPQGSLSSPMALSHATLHQQHQQQQQQQALLHTGIYPIQEESSGALAQDTSTYSMQQQQQQQQLESMQYQQQQQPQAGLLPSVVHNPHLHASQQPQQQSSWEGAGPGVGPGGFGGPGGAAGGVGRGKGLKGMIREEDLRRRQEAAALAAQALAANTRVSDWQSKFAG